MYIGKRVRELRQQQNMSLSQLSESSGIQIATLSRMEHHKMTGTLESHIKIARALGVDVTQLYTDLLREESRPDIITKKTLTDVFVHSDASSYEILTSRLLSKKMMPIMLKIEANGKTNTEQNLAGSEKFVYILEGSIEVQIGEEKYALKKNNSLYFNASNKHIIINTGSKEARLLCVTSPVNL